MGVFRKIQVVLQIIILSL